MVCSPWIVPVYVYNAYADCGKNVKFILMLFININFLLFFNLLILFSFCFYMLSVWLLDVSTIYGVAILILYGIALANWRLGGCYQFEDLYTVSWFSCISFDLLSLVLALLLWFEK